MKDEDSGRNSKDRAGQTPVRSRFTLLTVLAPLLALVWLSLDYLTKEWALTELSEGRAVPVLGEALQWMLVKNPGAAFSFGSGATWIFTLLSVIVGLIIVWNLRKVRSAWWGIVLGLILGGILGNLADRLFREPGFPLGHVIDFIYTPWMMPAIYNVADIGIVVGMVLLVLLTLVGVSMDGTRRKPVQEGDEAAPEAEESA